jgi:hypothetical protein
MAIVHKKKKEKRIDRTKLLNYMARYWLDTTPSSHSRGSYLDFKPLMDAIINGKLDAE